MIRTSVGEFLRDELRERGLTHVAFAELIGRPPQVVSEIIHGKKSITPTTALQIGTALGTSAQFWLRLQNNSDLERLEADHDMRRQLAAIRRRRKHVFPGQPG